MWKLTSSHSNQWVVGYKTWFKVIIFARWFQNTSVVQIININRILMLFTFQNKYIRCYFFASNFRIWQVRIFIAVLGSICEQRRRNIIKFQSKKWIIESFLNIDIYHKFLQFACRSYVSVDILDIHIYNIYFIFYQLPEFIGISIRILFHVSQPCVYTY